MMPPSIGYLPEGWQLVFEAYYGQYAAADEPKTGSLQYNNEASNASVFIEYGDLPEWASGKGYDAAGFLREALNQRCDSCQKSEPDEMGTMTFCDRPAAYAKFSLPQESAFGIVVIYINGTVMIGANAAWTTTEQENEAMSIIDSVSFNQ
jgi:hypothetical protein